MGDVVDLNAYRRAKQSRDDPGSNAEVWGQSLTLHIEVTTRGFLDFLERAERLIRRDIDPNDDGPKSA